LAPAAYSTGLVRANRPLSPPAASSAGPKRRSWTLSQGKHGRERRRRAPQGRAPSAVVRTSRPRR